MLGRVYKSMVNEMTGREFVVEEREEREGTSLEALRTVERQVYGRCECVSAGNRLTYGKKGKERIRIRIRVTFPGLGRGMWSDQEGNRTG